MLWWRIWSKARRFALFGGWLTSFLSALQHGSKDKLACHDCHIILGERERAGRIRARLLLMRLYWGRHCLRLRGKQGKVEVGVWLKIGSACAIPSALGGLLSYEYCLSNRSFVKWLIRSCLRWAS